LSFFDLTIERRIAVPPARREESSDFAKPRGRAIIAICSGTILSAASTCRSIDAARNPWTHQEISGAARVRGNSAASLR
jgi:hypothetical protein